MYRSHGLLGLVHFPAGGREVAKRKLFRRIAAERPTSSLGAVRWT